MLNVVHPASGGRTQMTEEQLEEVYAEKGWVVDDSPPQQEVEEAIAPPPQPLVVDEDE